MTTDIVIGAHYTHYKGSVYMVICQAEMESTKEKVVVYFSLNNYKHYARPLEEFKSKFTRTNNLHNGAIK